MPDVKFERRVSEAHSAGLSSFAVEVASDENLDSWIERQASILQQRLLSRSGLSPRDSTSTEPLWWLLGHADDGIIWGRIEGGRLKTSTQASIGDQEAESVCPVLRFDTLQKLRIFNDEAELFIWRTATDSWQGRLIMNSIEGDKLLERSIDERHILWGTTARELPNGFSIVTEEGLGIRHVVPVNLSGRLRNGSASLRLLVRQYLEEDPETGVVRIYTGRLVNVLWKNAQ